LRTVRPAQPEPTEPEDALEMSKQHLDLLSHATGLFEGLCAGKRTRNITGIFMNVARDLAGWLLGTTSHLVRTRVSRCRLADLLTHLVVLVPVLDTSKHYFVGDDEVDSSRPPKWARFGRNIRACWNQLPLLHVVGREGTRRALFCQTFKASCFGFGGSSTAFTVIANIA
jgi:hypothetical protein